MEHCLPSDFLAECRPRNQKPGHKRNGTLKAILNNDKHQVTVIEEQDKIIKALAAANAALQVRNDMLMQQGQQYRTWNKPPSWSRTTNAHAYLPSSTVSTIPFKAAKHYSHRQEKCEQNIRSTECAHTKSNLWISTKIFRG